MSRGALCPEFVWGEHEKEKGKFTYKAIIFLINVSFGSKQSEVTKAFPPKAAVGNPPSSPTSHCVLRNPFALRKKILQILVNEIG